MYEVSFKVGIVLEVDYTQIYMKREWDAILYCVTMHQVDILNNVNIMLNC